MDDILNLPLLESRTVAKEADAYYTQAKSFRIFIFIH